MIAAVIARTSQLTPTAGSAESVRLAKSIPAIAANIPARLYDRPAQP